jgi:phosphate transporter
MPSPNGGMTTSSTHAPETNLLYCLTIPSYDGLKKQIYLVEKRQSGLDTGYHDLESQRSPLLGSPDTDRVFSQYLDRELRKITLFYESQAAELFEDTEDLEAQVTEQEEVEIRNYPEFDEEDEDEEDEEGDRDRDDDTTPQPGEPRKKGVAMYC